MWRSGVVMGIGDIQATDTVDILDILIMEDTTEIMEDTTEITEDTTEEGGAHITGLIIEAIMATPMAAATTAGVEGFGLASGSKDEYAYRIEYEH
ncbi:MAG TPA: hypothetical protein VI479_10410 [Blastocatellia bacterium]